MVQKTKSGSANGAGKASAKKTADTDVFGVDAFKTGFEKVVGSYDEVAAFSQDNLEALVESANIAKERLEALQSEALTYSKNAFEDAAALTQAVMKARTVQEVIEIQNDFAKNALESYIGQLNRVTSLVAETAQEAAAPITERVNALIEKSHAVHS